MDPLANIIERFNRKERNLLIRDILDCRGKPLPSGSDFCERLTKTVEISKSQLEGAWWATDFHFDWLAGTLLTFMKGETLSRQAPQDRYGQPGGPRSRCCCAHSCCNNAASPDLNRGQSVRLFHSETALKQGHPPRTALPVLQGTGQRIAAYQLPLRLVLTR